VKSIFITILFSITSFTSLIAGGPWPQQKGVGYFKLSEWWTVFDQHYTDRGLIDPNVTTGVFNTSIYAEYGLTNRFTLIANAPILSRNYMNNLRSGTTNEIIVAGDALNSFGDLDIGFKYGLTKSEARIPIAASVILGLPTGKSSGGRDGNLQTGDGEFNQMIQIDAGLGFKIGSVPAYSSGFIGFNNRTNGFSEEIRYGLELGLGLVKSKLWINIKLSAVESLKNGLTAETVTSTSIFANNTEFTSIGLEANYYLTNRFGFSAGYATAVKGEIIAAAPSYSIGIFYDMKN
jgi:hypothetical protein